MDSIANILSLTDQYERRLPDRSVELTPPEGEAVAGWIECSLLQPEATLMQVKALCDDARQNQFAAVCVNPGYVSLASGLLANTRVPVSAAVAYPLGASLPTLKVIEALTCLSNGAEEIDMVLNMGALKGEAYGQVLNEIYAVTQVVHNQRASLTITLETVLLTRREIIIASLLCKAAGADYIKPHTDFSEVEVQTDEIDLLARIAGPEVKIKAAGCIDNPQVVRSLVKAGAVRIVSRNGVRIIQDEVQ